MLTKRRRKMNDDLAQEIISIAVDALRYGKYLSNIPKYKLAILQKRIAEILQVWKFGNISAARRLQQAETLYKKIEVLIDETYREIAENIEKELSLLYPVLTDYLVDKIYDLAGEELLEPEYTQEKARDIVAGIYLLGAKHSEWWARQGNQLKLKVGDMLRMHALGNQTVDILLAKINGTETGRILFEQNQLILSEFSGGLFDAFLKQSDSLVNTLTSAVDNSIQFLLYTENKKVKGVQALVTLDNKTSALCRSRVGFAWTLDGAPFNSLTNISFPGPPPWHWNCRTILVPIIGNYVPDPNITFADWYAKQTPENQTDFFGVRKVTQFTTVALRPMTFTQLKNKYSV